MKTLNVYKNGQWEEVVAPPAGLEDYAKTEYVDREVANLGGAFGSYQSLIDNKLDLLGQGFATVAQKADVYTKAEVDAKLPDITAEIIVSAIKDADIEPSNVRVGTVYLTSVAMAGRGGRIVTANESGKMETVALLSDLEAVSAPDLSAYAKTADNTQNLVANATVAKGYTFGDSISPNNPGLVYADTGEGYGLRLVLDTPTGKELIPYQSDFEPIKARMDALENKAAPTVDLAPYVTLEFADSTYGRKEALDLLRSQTQVIFDSLYTRVEADARYSPKADTYTKSDCDTKFLTTVDISRFPLRDEVYTQKQCEDRFIRIESALSTIDFDNRMVTTLYSRKQVDDKLTAISPLGSPTINDPALADFKKSVLDEVKKLMAGGKTVPADVGWTKLLNAGTAVNAPEAKVLNGVVYMRGEAVKQGGAGYTANAYQLPPAIPAPPREMVVPLAMKNTSPAGRYYGYATIQTNRQIGVSCDNAFNTVWFDGISYPAYE